MGNKTGLFLCFLSVIQFAVSLRFKERAIVGDAPTCGLAPLANKNNNNNLRIAGGEIVSPHSYPWQVALYVDGKYTCGGSVIAPEWVLTAANCVDGKDDVVVVAGAHDLEKEEASQVRVSVSEKFSHEEFELDDPTHNIAVLKLANKLEFNDYVQPICLPRSDSEALHTAYGLNYTGWGEGRKDEAPSSELHVIKIPIADKDECLMFFKDLDYNENIYCSRRYSQHSPCKGDVGGPANNFNGQFTEQYGILSYVSKVCTSGLPQVNIRVSTYIGWIAKKTGLKFE